jgi:hypothetical protein
LKEVKNYKQMNRILLIFTALLLVSCGGNKADESSNKPENPDVCIISTSDSLILAQVWQVAKNENWQQKSLAEIEMQVAELFLETPYVAGTLDKDSVEKLVINLQGFDCVTFVENVVALSLTIKSGALSNPDFVQYLLQFRYRNSKLNGYASRLHYFSEWLTDNQQKGLLSLVSDSLGDEGLDTQVDIISRNWSENKFAVDTKLLTQIKEAETRIAKFKLKYITREKLETVENQIQDGDIIAITTSINGLDVAHTGIAIHVNEQLHLCHASSALGKVVISDVPLSEYLQAKKSFIGVLVARLVE